MENPFIQRRLDYFILSEGLQNSIKIIDIITSVQSDHSVLKLKITPINEDTRGRWEYMKYKMREFSMTFSKQEVYQRKKRRLFLENRAKTLEIKLATSSDEEIVEQHNDVKIELESIYDYITEGIILRSKASWYEHGENPLSISLT